MSTLQLCLVALSAVVATLSLVVAVMISFRVSAVHGEQRDIGAKLGNLEEASARANALVQLELASTRDAASKSANQLRESLVTNFTTLTESFKSTSPGLGEPTERQFSVLAECLSQMKADSAKSAAILRDEVLGQISQALVTFQSARPAASAPITALLENNDERLDALRQSVEERLSDLRSESIANANLLREEVASSLQEQASAFIEQVTEKLAQVASAIRDQADRNAQKETVRLTVEASLAKFRSESEAKLEQMYAAFNEKIQAPFAELHLPGGINLNGTFGKDQAGVVSGRGALGAVLRQTLTLDQFEKNVEVRPGTGDRVDYAVRLPSKDAAGHRWLPLAAQFPFEQYDRLIDASIRGDVELVEQAGKALEAQVRLAAKSLSDKGIHPPFTTEFAVLFVPLEGPFAEVTRRPGLVEALKRDYGVVIAGPTALMALLNGLKSGFREAMEPRTADDFSGPHSKFNSLSRTRAGCSGPRLLASPRASDVEEGISPTWNSRRA